MKLFKKKFLFFFKKKNNKKNFFLIFYFKNNFFNKIKEIDKLIFKIIFNKKIIKKKIINLIKLLFIYFLKKKKNIFKIKNNILLFFIKSNFKKAKINKNFFFIINNLEKIIKKNIFKIKINGFFLNNINFLNYLIFIKSKIKKDIIKNNLIFLKKILKKNKQKDLYQESIFLLTKEINNFNYYKKKNFFKFCYWKLIKLKKNKKNNFLSLNKKINEKNTLESIIFNKEFFFLKKYDEINLNLLIKKILLEFPLREQKILRLRFGIEVKKIYTLEEIGFLFLLTKERIRQLELKILFKIKNSFRSEVLKPYINIYKKK